MKVGRAARGSVTAPHLANPSPTPVAILHLLSSILCLHPSSLSLPPSAFRLSSPLLSTFSPLPSRAAPRRRLKFAQRACVVLKLVPHRLSLAGQKLLIRGRSRERAGGQLTGRGVPHRNFRVIEIFPALKNQLTVPGMKPMLPVEALGGPQGLSTAFIFCAICSRAVRRMSRGGNA